MIRDRIVVGLRDQKLSERLQLEADLTLEKAMTMPSQSESVRRQQSVKGEIKRAIESSINVVNRQKGLVRSAKEKKSESSSYKQFCTRCGKSPTRFKDCPARGATCHKCS